MGRDLTGKELESILKNSGYSVKDFADLIGKSERAVQYWISGDRKMPRYIELIVKEPRFVRSLPHEGVGHLGDQQLDQKEYKMGTKEALELLEIYLTGVCIADNAIDYVCIVNFSPGEEVSDAEELIVAENKEFNEKRRPDLSKIHKIIIAEREKYIISRYQGERFEKFNDLLLAWVHIDSDEFMVFASKDSYGERIFRQGVRDEKGTIKEKYALFRKSMKVK